MEHPSRAAEQLPAPPPATEQDARPTRDEVRGTARIVVGVDGSDQSIAALHRGARIAKALHASLEAITTWHFDSGFVGVASEYSPEADALTILADAATSVFGDAPPPWFSSVAHEGNADLVLIDQSRGAEMLIVGSRGHGGFVGLLLGSVSAMCAERAHCPVLIMH